MLHKIKEFLIHDVHPFINQTNDNESLLSEIFRAFRHNKYFSIYISLENNGKELSHHEKIEFQEAMGQFGGAFSFLQVQAATAAWIIQQNSSATIRKNYIYPFIAGELTIANATSYMKPNTKSMVVGKKKDNGYEVSGIIPFASGWKFYDKILIGFYTEELNKEIFAVIPFDTVHRGTGQIEINECLNSISMRSINTVKINLKNFLILKEEIIIEWPMHYFFNQYKNFLPYAYTLGIALEALRFIEQSSLLTEDAVLFEEHGLLKTRLDDCRNEIRKHPHALSNTDLFGYIIDVSWRCVQLATVVSGGSGLIEGNSVQRLYKEILLWIIPRAYPSVITSWIKKSYERNKPLLE